MTIKFVDLGAQTATIREELNEAIARIVQSSAFIGGKELSQFEQEFADFCAVQRDGAAESPTLHCAGCGNGTDALFLALREGGVGPGDEVITTAHTFIATAEAIGRCGATPVFADVLPDTLLINPSAVEAAVTPRTRAILAVHLYGQPCDMDRLAAIARRHGVLLIEDAAQAHGAYWNGRRVGTLGDAACFSFFPGKNLGAFGDGGAVVSRDRQLIDRVRMHANHGRKDKYLHEFEGVNSRLDGLQAAVLRVKLRHLDHWNAARGAAARAYDESLATEAVRTPTIAAQAESVWHLYVVRTERRDALREHLQTCDIASGIHYPVPLHLQPAYRSLKQSEGSLPVTERAAREILSLPMCPMLAERAVQTVAGAIGRWQDQRKVA